MTSPSFPLRHPHSTSHDPLARLHLVSQELYQLYYTQNCTQKLKNVITRIQLVIEPILINMNRPVTSFTCTECNQYPTN